MLFGATNKKTQRRSAGRWLLVLVLLPWLTSSCLETRADERTLSSRQRLTAQRLILSHNCGACHTLEDGVLRLRGTIGPRLSRSGRPAREYSWLRRQLTDPVSIPDTEVVPGFEGKQRLMPPLELPEKDLDLLIRYLQSVR